MMHQILTRGGSPKELLHLSIFLLAGHHEIWTLKRGTADPQLVQKILDIRGDWASPKIWSYAQSHGSLHCSTSNPFEGT